MLRREIASGLIAVSLAAMGQAACRPRPPQPANPARPGPVAAPGPPAEDVAPVAAGKMKIQSSKPVRWSSKFDPEGRRMLRIGRRRVVISVNEYEPPTAGPAVLVAYLLTANGAKRQEVGRFGVFPNTPFKVSAGGRPQLFQISLADQADSLEASELHLEIGFDPGGGQLKGGLAEITVAFEDLEPPPPEE